MKQLLAAIESAANEAASISEPADRSRMMKAIGRILQAHADALSEQDSHLAEVEAVLGQLGYVVEG